MTVQPQAGLRPPPAGDPAERPWIRLVDGRRPPSAARKPPPTARRVLAQFVVANLVAVALLLAGSVWASAHAAKSEALADARTTTDVLGTVLVQPALSDGLPQEDARAVSAVDRVVRSALLDTALVRVKIWAPDGRIVYSDEARLIGSAFPLGDDEQESLRDGATMAEVSDLTRPENRYERSQGRLLEVYRPLSLPSGQRLLFETYSRYGSVNARQMDIWLTFAPISAAVLILLLLVQLPLGRRMVRQLHEGEQERLRLQERAAAASTDERRRIAGSLHDGIVQDLAAASFVVSGAADELDRTGSASARGGLATTLRTAAGAVRGSVTALRSLLIEIYPPHLAQAGLPSALRNLAVRLRPRGVDLQVDVPDDLDVPPETAALIFRVAQEALLNVTKHAAPQAATLSVAVAPDLVTLEVSDDGRGFDPTVTASTTGNGHFGLHVLTDLAEAAGATLDLATAPGAGTALRLEIPLS